MALAVGSLELAAGLIGLYRQFSKHWDDPGVVFIGLRIYEKTVGNK